MVCDQDRGRPRSRHHRPERSPAAAKAAQDRLNRKVETALAVLCLAALAVIAPFWVVQSWTRWQTSVETQDHGVGSTFTVERVTRVFHGTGHGGGFFTTHLQGDLDPPVEGRTQTTVYIPDGTRYAASEQFPVLVDPAVPTHAERPGLEACPGADVVGTVALTLVLDLALLVCVVGLVLRVRSRKDQPCVT